MYACMEIHQHCDLKKKKKKYQFNPRVYADSDGINGFHVVPPVLGNKQDLESETVC